MITTQHPSIGLDGTWEFIPDPGARLGPRSLPAGSSLDGSAVIVASELDRSPLADVDRGLGLLLLVARSPEATRAGPASPDRSRSGVAGPAMGPLRPMLHWRATGSRRSPGRCRGTIPALPAGGLLGGAHRQIYPDHVIDGRDPTSPADSVSAGMFAGWLHGPAALLEATRP